ncbi:unnamed protein product, partial [Pylaiella littoralis]
MRFGIDVGNGRRIKHPMGDIVREASAGAGIHSIINTNVYRVEHEVIESRDHPGVKEKLSKASRDANFELKPMQLETIMYAVWRPRTTTKLNYFTRPGVEVSRRFTSPLTDMGSPVLVDLPPGTGKTIVCILACLLLSIERSGEVLDQTSRASPQGFAEVSVSARAPHEGRVSMIFKALEILSKMYPSKRIIVEQNKKASEVASADVDAAAVICDSAAFGLSDALERNTVYGTLCFDESTENCNTQNNAIYSEAPRDLSFGRVIMISADFSKMADINSKVGSSRPGSMLRRIFGDAKTIDFRRAVGQPGYFDTFSKKHYDAGCKIVAALTMNAVFPADKRADIVNASSNLLEGINLHTFGIKYK